MDNLCICSHALDYPLTTDKKQNLGDFKMKNTKDVQLIEQENKQVQTQTQNDSAALISVIERAATNPEVDIDKMERLLDMQERMLDRQAKADFNVAYNLVSAELPTIGKRGELKVKSKKEGVAPFITPYALFEDINETIKPILARHNMSLRFKTETKESTVRVTAVLSHISGHSEETSFTVPADVGGSKNHVQAMGSSISYAKRYTLVAILNITTFKEDDDGFKAGFKADQISEMQAKTIIKALGNDEKRIDALCKHYSIESVSELPTHSYTDALTKAKRK